MIGKTSGVTRGRRVRGVAMVSVLLVAALLPSTGAGSSLLGRLLAPVIDVVDDLLDPILGDVAEITGIPLDDAVSDLLDGVVDDLIGSVETLIIPDDGAPLAPPDFDDLAQLRPLEPIDPLYEDLVVPTVLGPAGDALAPLTGASVGTAPFSLGTILGEVVGAVRPALEPLSLDVAAHVVEVDVVAADGTVTTRRQDGLVDVPSLVDTNADGIDDLSIELRIISTRPSLRVTRLPGAPAGLRAAVRTTLAPNGWSAPERLSVGFDATETGVADLARVTVTDLGLDGGEIAAELHTVGATGAIAVTAAMYDQGAGDQRIAPTDVRIGFAPAPADAAVAASDFASGGTGGRVAVTTSSPSRVDAAVTTTDAGGATEVGAVIDRVPGSVELGVSLTADAAALDYAASGPVDRIALRIAETEGGVTRSTELGIEGIDATTASFAFSPDDLGFEASAPIDALTVEIIDPRGVLDRATTLRARLEGLPTDLTVDLGDTAGSGIGVDAGAGQLDLLEVQLTSGPDLALPTEVDGVLLEDLADHFVAFVRLRALQSVQVSTADGLSASLASASGRPFVADIRQGDDAERILARLSSLPATIDLSLVETEAGASLDYTASAVVATLDATIEQGQRSLHAAVTDLPTQVRATLGGDAIVWEASSVVPSIAIDVVDPAGLGGAITDVRARLSDVPATFTATLGDEISIDAGTGAFGTFDLLASDGTATTAVPDGVDGLVLVDEPGQFAAALRLTGLRRIGFNPDPLSLSLGTVGARVFEVDVHRLGADGTSDDIRATIDALPADVTLTVGDGADGATRIGYEASAPVDSLVGSLTTAAPDGSTTSVALEVLDLPTELTLELGDDGVQYTASDRVPLLRAEVVDPDGLVGIATRLRLELTDLPPSFGFGLADDGTVTFAADTSAVGEIDALVTSGPELALPDGVDGLYLVDRPDEFMAALHLTGLRSVTFSPADGASIALGTVGGQPFEIQVDQSDDAGSSTEVRATLDPLPADVAIDLSGGSDTGLALDYTASAVLDQLRAQVLRTVPGQAPTTVNLEADEVPTALSIALGDDGAVTYSASARLPRLAVQLADPAGLVDRATELHLLALDLPTGLRAALDPDGALEATTEGGNLGLLEALITSGPAIGLDDGVDGIVLRDTADEFAVFARLTDVAGLGFASLDGGAELSLQTGASRTLEVDVQTENPDEGTASTIRATLESLPSSVALSLTDDVDGRNLTYSASAPMPRLFGDIALTDAGGTNTFAIEVLDLPRDLSLELAASGALGYTASDRVGRLSVTGENPDGIFLRATRLQAVLEDLPPSLSILLGEDGNLGLDAGGDRLGHLDVLATNGPEIGPADGAVGAVIRDTETDFVVSFRFDDIGRLTVEPDPIALEIDSAGGDLFVLQAVLDGGDLIDLGTGSVNVEATIDRLPDAARLGFGLDGGAQQLSVTASSTIDAVSFELTQKESSTAPPLTAALLIDEVPTSLELSIDITGAVSYAASAPVPALAIDASDPSGLFDRASDLSLRLDQLPLGLDVVLSEDGAIAIDTVGGKLGRLEALATTGPDNRVPAGADGILLEDLVDRFVVSARFTNLYSGDVSQVPQPRVALVTDGGRPLSLGLYQSEPGKPSKIPGVAYTEASLENLPATVDLELLDGAPGTINVEYAASSTAQRLELETNAGNRWVTRASIANPVPATFRACQAGDGRCADSGQSSANVGSFRFVASEHTTLDVLDCAAPLNSSCTAANGTKLTAVQNLRVRSLGFEGDFDDCGFLGQQACGHLFVDTLPDGASASLSNAHTLSGRIFNRDGDTKLTLDFGSNFKAANRLVRFSKFPNLFFSRLSTTKTGSVSCTSGTALNISVKLLFTLNFDGRDLLC